MEGIPESITIFVKEKRKKTIYFPLVLLVTKDIPGHGVFLHEVQMWHSRTWLVGMVGMG